ncbi:hypothetical protein V1289_005075 [Bradyrhizobium sp. AZCC 2289]
MSRSFSRRLTPNFGHGCPNVAPAPPQYVSMLLEWPVWLFPIERRGQVLYSIQNGVAEDANECTPSRIF